MGGGLLQLVSYGAQDIYISGNPQITFWKVLFKRHTNFAMESIEVTFNGQADFNKRVTAIINRNADLMYRTYVQVVLPTVDLVSLNASVRRFRWLNYIGHRLIKTVELEIGGQRIDRQYGDWMQIWTQLSQDAGTISALDDMIGNTHDLVLMKDGKGYQLDASCAGSELTNSCAPRAGTPAKTLYIPLQFWFCRNPGLAIPLIALQYHEVRINVEFEQWINCTYVELVSGQTAPTSIQSLTAASLYIDYIYLDTEERRRFAQQTHEYLIEQLQFTGAESITSSSNKIQLNFNHPVKELVWVVQRDSFVDCTPNQGFIAEVNGMQPFNYSDDFTTEGIVMDVLARGGLAGGANAAVVPTASNDGPSVLTSQVLVSNLVHLSKVPLGWILPLQASPNKENRRLSSRTPPTTCSPRSSLPLESSVKVRTLLKSPSSNSTDKIVSLNVRDDTSRLSNHSNTTLVLLPRVSTCTPSRSSLRNISHLVHATSLVLTRPLSNSLCPLTPCDLDVLPKCVCMPSTTTCCV